MTNIIRISVCLWLFSTTEIFAQTSTMPAPCNQYLEYMGLDDAVSVSRSTCIPFEEMVMSATDWRAFIWNFDRFFSSDGYPIQLEMAFTALSNQEFGKALVHFDAAVSNIQQVFTKTEDTMRSKVYLFLVLKARNTMFRSFAFDSKFWSDLDSIAKPSALEQFTNSEFEDPHFLRCLMALDAWTSPINAILKSTKFEVCLNKEGN